MLSLRMILIYCFVGFGIFFILFTPKFDVGVSLCIVALIVGILTTETVASELTSAQGTYPSESFWKEQVSDVGSFAKSHAYASRMSRIDTKNMRNKAINTSSNIEGLWKKLFK